MNSEHESYSGEEPEADDIGIAQNNLSEQEAAELQELAKSQSWNGEYVLKGRFNPFPFPRGSKISLNIKAVPQALAEVIECVPKEGNRNYFDIKVKILPD